MAHAYKNKKVDFNSTIIDLPISLSVTISITIAVKSQKKGPITY